MLTEQATVREATVSEVDAVRRILEEAHAFTRELMPRRAHERYMALILDVEGRLPNSELLVAEVGGRLVGTVAYFPDASAEGWGHPHDVAGIRAMGVAPSAKRRGAGSALVRACITRAETSGLRAVTLHTAHFLPDAARLYERHGFRRDPARDVPAARLIGIPDAEWGEPALAYRLDLT